MSRHNSTADVSPTAAQMPRLVGLAYASGLYRELDELQDFRQFSNHGDEVAFGTIGNASTAEGMFARRAGALKYHEETLAPHKAKLGPDHPDTLQSICNLAGNYLIDGQYSEALKHYQEALGALKARMGPNHRTTHTPLKGIAECLLELGRGAEAVAILDDWLAQAPGKIARNSVEMASAVAMLRMRHFENLKDAAGCRASIVLWETLKLQDVLAAPEGTDHANNDVWKRLKLREAGCLYDVA